MSNSVAYDILDAANTVVQLYDTGTRLYGQALSAKELWDNYRLGPAPKKVMIRGGRFLTSKKRARDAPGYRRRMRHARERPFKIPRKQTGYVRTSGFYGRYSGPFAQELKFLDVDVADTIIAAGGLIIDTVNVIAQGTTQSERIGRKVVISKILFKYTIDLPKAASSDGAESDIVRLIMYQDKQCNGAAAVLADILTAADPRAFRALDNVGRFTILMDRTEVLNPVSFAGNGTANDAGEVYRFRKFYQNCAIPIEFDSTTGAITEIKSNNIGILILSEKGNAGFEGKIRLRYKG